MRERLPIFAFVLALLVGALAVLFARASKGGEFAEPFSTYRSEPDGSRALFLLAQAAGLPVVRRHTDLELIEGSPALVMLGIEGDLPELSSEPDAGERQRIRMLEGNLGHYEIESLLKAVDEGVPLIYGVTRDHPFLTELGVHFTPAEDKASRTLTAFSPSPLTREVHTLQGRISGYLSASGALPVLIDRHHGDQAVALLIRRGKGRILVLAAPTLASNRELGQDDAARFWLNTLSDFGAGHARIEFDEYHHGFTGERSVMGYAARYGLPWAIAQGIFALGIWVLALRRFGMPLAIRDDQRRASADYLLAMARIYRLGGHRGHAAQALVRGATRALAALAPGGGHRDLIEVAGALEVHGRGDLAQQLRDLAVRASGPLDDAALLQLAREAAALRQLATHLSPASSGETAP